MFKICLCFFGCYRWVGINGLAKIMYMSSYNSRRETYNHFLLIFIISLEWKNEKFVVCLTDKTHRRIRESYLAYGLSFWAKYFSKFCVLKVCNNLFLNVFNSSKLQKVLLFYFLKNVEIWSEYVPLKKNWKQGKWTTNS